jgi:hypothetical protein
MPRGRLGAEQIVTKLRQIEVLQGQGKSVSAACKEAGTTEQTHYRWRKEYGGLNVHRTGGTSTRILLMAPSVRSSRFLSFRRARTPGSGKYLIPALQRHAAPA